MRWLKRRRELRRLKKQWLREHRGGACVILGRMDPSYDPPSGSMNPAAVVNAHPWQEYNAYGNTCHHPGCRLTEDEHAR